MTHPQPLADPSRACDRLEFRGAGAEETLTDAWPTRSEAAFYAANDRFGAAACALSGRRRDASPDDPARGHKQALASRSFGLRLTVAGPWHIAACQTGVN